MKTFSLDRKFERIIFLGDIHGHFDIINYIVRKFELRNTLIVQVGDFGMRKFNEHQLRLLEDMCSYVAKYDVTVVAIRGNHDDPAVFKNQFYRPNLFLMEDYTMMDININGVTRRMLGIGGAVSIDRVHRKMNGMQYWAKEPVVIRQDAKYLDQFTGVHYLVTHTADEGVEPYSFGPLVYHFAKNDPTLLEDLRIERRNFTYVLNYLIDKNIDTLKEHFYGHFHFSATGWNRGFRRNLLAVNEIKEINVQVHNHIDDDGADPEPAGDRDTPAGEGPVA